MYQVGQMGIMHQNNSDTCALEAFHILISPQDAQPGVMWLMTGSSGWVEEGGREEAPGRTFKGFLPCIWDCIFYQN